MERTKKLIVIDIITFVSFLGILVSVIGRSMISRQIWGVLHKTSGTILIIMLFIHLFLHWNWVKNIPEILRK